jgi:hypothetical protein
MPAKAMTEAEKYQGYAWIKVRKHAFDSSKTDRQNYDDLHEHHVAETMFLIERIRELAQRLDATRPGPDGSPQLLG